MKVLYRSQGESDGILHEKIGHNFQEKNLHV